MIVIGLRGEIYYAELDAGVTCVKQFTFHTCCELTPMLVATNIDSMDLRVAKKETNTKEATRTSIVPDFHEFLRLHDVT